MSRPDTARYLDSDPVPNFVGGPEFLAGGEIWATHQRYIVL